MIFKMNREEIILKFAQNLRAERARKGYSQEFLAEKAGLSRDYISRLERNEMNPTIVTVVNIAQALEIPINELLKFD